jgi:tetratricopeptide (TPR) repeat protein
VLLFFACGLMSKPMLVTLPFVLLLLDYWPLNRLRTDAGPGFRPSVRPVFKRLVFEKLPLFGLAAASGVTTLFTQTGAIAPFERISIPFRVGNASISYVTYMGQMFWPSGLAVFYPFPPGGNGVARVVLSMVLLAGISAGVFVLRRRPYLLTGWLWYLIMLVPVIGIVQSGAQARADRFTYFPQIGLYLLLTWAVTDLVAGWRHRRVVLIGLSTVILVALIVCARAQTAYWRNSVSLWIHTLACTSDNAEVHSNLGIALFQKGDVDAAMVHFRKALQINPDDPEAHDNFGTALFETGRLDEAIAHFRKALQINPDNAIAQNNLGNALLRKGSVGEAITHFQKALQIMPDSASAHYNLGNILLQTGNGDEAMFHYQKALQIKPGYAEAHYNLGNILVQKGRVGEAITQFQTALQIKPDYAKALNNLAWLLATCSQASLRNGNQAVELAQRANQFAGGGNPVFLGTLATAYAEAGRFPEAVETAQRALQLAEAQSNPALADAIRSKLKLYQAGSPFHYAEHTP